MDPMKTIIVGSDGHEVSFSHPVDRTEKRTFSYRLLNPGICRHRESGRRIQQGITDDQVLNTS
jgi:hypothetical protein